MNAKTFLDTNVLLYADDFDSPAKQKRAENLIEHLISTRTGCVSMQVLQEYFSTATRKLRMSPNFARRKIELYTGFNVLTLQPVDLFAAIDLHRDHQFSIWDALIVRAALISDCEILYSEDMQDGQRIDGLTIVNPF